MEHAVWLLIAWSAEQPRALLRPPAAGWRYQVARSVSNAASLPQRDTSVALAKDRSMSRPPASSASSPSASFASCKAILLFCRAPSGIYIDHSSECSVFSRSGLQHSFWVLTMHRDDADHSETAAAWTICLTSLCNSRDSKPSNIPRTSRSRSSLSWSSLPSAAGVGSPAHCILWRSAIAGS